MNQILSGSGKDLGINVKIAKEVDDFRMEAAFFAEGKHNQIT